MGRVSVSRSCVDIVVCCRSSPPSRARSRGFSESEVGWGPLGARPDSTEANGLVEETSLAVDLRNRVDR